MPLVGCDPSGDRENYTHKVFRSASRKITHKVISCLGLSAAGDDLGYEHADDL